MPILKSQFPNPKSQILTWTSQNQTGKISNIKKQNTNKSQKTKKIKVPNRLNFLKFGNCNLFVI
jgi:hypothetical protein